MTPHNINQLDAFISGWYKDDDTCDEIIDYIQNTNYKWPGLSKSLVNKSLKDSTDSILTGDLLVKYCSVFLKPTVDLYIEKYPYCNFYAPWQTTEPVQVQHYAPGQGYHAWHTERCTAQHPINNRHMVFMTYLNTVDDDGETEFFHQKLKVKAERGLTMIWPSDWTFTHRGIKSMTQDKYIVTGWLSFID